MPLLFSSGRGSESCIARLMSVDKWNNGISKRSFFHEYIRSHVFKSIRDTLDIIPEEYHGFFYLRFVLRKDLDVIENTTA